MSVDFHDISSLKFCAEAIAGRWVMAQDATDIQLPNYIKNEVKD